jgi:mRNA interferase RelE/StbE
VRYEVHLARAADRDLGRLPPDVERRVIERIEALGEDPRPPGATALRGALKGLRRIRVGDYRVSYVVDDATRVVTIAEVGYRRDIYRRAKRRRR